MRRRFGMRVILLAALSWACAIAPALAQTQVKPGFNIFSASQDAQIGAQSAAQVDRQMPMVNDAVVNRYVSALGAKLAAQAPGPKFTYRFKVANLSDVNAFALPGGYIYVHRGLIESVRSEGELAGVMAHEIAHVALRHPTNQVSKAYLAQAGVGILGGLLGQHSGTASNVVNALGGFGLNSLFLKFSRTAESQADIVGSQIMARAGYDPNEMANFFGQMEKTANGNPSKVAVFFSDHPAPANRQARVRQEAALIGAVHRTSNVGSLASAQSDLRSLGAAPSMAQLASNTTTTTGSSGSTTASVPQPSSSYRLYRQRQGLFQIEQPDNWSAYTSSGYGVTFAPPGGIVSGSNGHQGILVGVIVNHYVPFEGSIGAGYRNASLESATADLVNQIQQSNSYLRHSGTDRRLTVSGHPSYATTLVGASPGGDEERITVVTSELPDQHIMYMMLVGRSQDYSAISPAFNHMLRSIRFNESAQHD